MTLDWARGPAPGADELDQLVYLSRLIGGDPRLVADLFQGEVVYVPYARPGFPLARMVNGMVNGISARAIGLALAHHGLVVWGADPAECCARLERVVHRIEDYLERSRRGRAVLGATPHSIATAEVRRRCAQLVLPIVRGALGPPAGGRVILP